MDLSLNKSEEHSNLYLGMRQQALELKPVPGLLAAAEGHPVYAGIVDLELAQETTATLVCFADRTTSLYFSNGRTELGLGQKYKAVGRAAQTFLFSAEQVLSTMEQVKEYPLPMNGKQTVYLVTQQGIYKQELQMSEIESAPREAQFLNFLYQNVLAAIRTSMEKEPAVGS